MPSLQPDPSRVAEALSGIRTATPLVHCITNIVVAGFTANVLLALGASPAMVENDHESADFAAVADGLLVNLGTLSDERARACLAAAEAAYAAGKPWVLDPVAVGTAGLSDRTGDRPARLLPDGHPRQRLGGAQPRRRGGCRPRSGQHGER